METDTATVDVTYAYDMSGMRSSKTVVYGVGEAHTHEYTSAVTAPTCTTAGYTTYTCDCGESYVDNLVDALGHNYVQSGNVYTCSRCGDSYTGHEHSYTEATTEPTCLTAGYTVYTCSCGDSYTVDIPALGHNYVLVGQSGNVATYECSRCGHRYTAVIPVDPNPPVEYSLRSGTTVTEHHEYVYASGQLMRETITTTANGTSTIEVLDFVYGSGSTPLALVYTNGTANPVTYYYVTNMQGDVVKLVTASGTAVATYAYDAWGKVLSATGSMAEVNPIRYRGYHYDAEIGMYYLQSRYYDPAVKRFISADGIATTGQGFLGYNMFAYCNNNPANTSDPTGYAAPGLPITAIPIEDNSPSVLWNAAMVILNNHMINQVYGFEYDLSNCVAYYAEIGNAYITDGFDHMDAARVVDFAIAVGTGIYAGNVIKGAATRAGGRVARYLGTNAGAFSLGVIESAVSWATSPVESFMSLAYNEDDYPTEPGEYITLKLYVVTSSETDGMMTTQHGRVITWWCKPNGNTGWLTCIKSVSNSFLRVVDSEGGIYGES